MNVEQYALEIKKQLRQQGYCGKKVNYNELQHLHKVYGSEFPEKEFALYVLELGVNQYQSVKNGKYKTTILQEQLTKIIEQEAARIRNQLLLQGYAGKLINYTELQSLHQTYGTQMPEDVFAKHILELSKSSYTATKAGRREKVYILRNLQNESSEEIEQMKEKIRADGYAGKLINYQELQNLHKVYGLQLSESRFAQRVLEIGENSYLSSKNHGTRVIVLKSFIGKTSKEEIERIKEILSKDGYIGKKIDYIELQKLHQTYGKQMLEREFAQRVLGITYTYYINVKNNPKKRAVILKNLLAPKVFSEEVENTKKQLKRTTIQLSEEEINKIKKQLELQGYVKKTIDYTELQQLHQTYASQMSEKDFAKSVLEISDSHYMHMKYENNKAVILKSLIIPVSQEEIEGIKTILREQKLENSLITYTQLQELHKKYGSQMSESFFAQKVLGIIYPNYIGLKNGRIRKTRILKEMTEIPMDLEEIKEIKEELQLQGYAGKSILYSELQQLHQMYGSQITEEQFAKEILEITYSQYHIVKSGQGKAKILKSLTFSVSVEELEKIKEQMRLQGYADNFIDYTKLQELHQVYGSNMSEREFAQNVLGISYSFYGDIKSGRRKQAKILRSIETSLEDIEKIKQQLKLQGYTDTLIDYSQLQELHQTYGKQMSEREFAENVLGVNWWYIKHKNGKVVILKTLPNQLTLQEKEKIRERLVIQGYVGKIVDYQELQRLHKTYGSQMPENEFAQDILEITYGQYMHIKNEKGTIAILKNASNLIEQEKIQEIKQKLKTEGYVGKSINYTELQILHKKYGSQMPESKFARDVLEIIPSQYRRMKKGIRNSIILKSLTEQVTLEEIDKIKQELEMQGYCGIKINYEEFRKIYQIYGTQMPEYQFAQAVLGISAALLSNMRRLPKARARILKSYTIPISVEEIEAIQEILEEKGYGGKLIDYSEFQMLHQMYGEQMREEVFAQVVLEIPRIDSYHKLKEGAYRTQILCSNKKVELIHGMLFQESRWYTKEEIEQICLENGISLDKLIRQIASNGTNLYTENYKRALEEKGKLWIGKIKLSDEFVEQNIMKIMKWAEIALKNVKKRYGITYNSEDDDMMQEAVLWLIESAGEAEKNFMSYPYIMEQRIFNTLRKNITLKVLGTLRINARTTSFNQRLTPKKKADKAKEGDELGSRIASSYNLQEDVINRDEEEQKRKNKENKIEETNFAERCIQEMKRQIEKGLSRKEVLSNIEEKFGLSKEKLLEIMQQYLLTNGIVKIKKRSS